MAQEIEEVDVVVGGHSHSFLFTGDDLPSIEKPEGPYPTYIKQPSGEFHNQFQGGGGGAAAEWS